MLERIFVLVDELVKVGRINEVVIFFGDDVIDVQAVLRQSPIVWIFDIDGVLVFSVLIASELVARVCRGFAVADDFGVPHTANRAMVGGD